MSPVTIERFTEQHVPAVRAFNDRLAAGGVAWRFPIDPVSSWLPPEPNATVGQEYFLLVQNDAVRGAYMLTRRQLWLDGVPREVGILELPLSEGTVNPRYSTVAYQMVRDALSRQPLLVGVGLGREDNRITQLIRAMRWRIRPVPFFFRVVHGARFCRHLRYLRTSRLRRLVLDLAAASGAAWLGAKGARALGSRARRNGADTLEVVERFEGWADLLWHRCRDRYAVLGTRDCDALNRIYSAANPWLRRLRISHDGCPVGYAVVEDRHMEDNEYFGDMRVGTILDGLALPEWAGAVVGASTRLLERSGVDLMVCNQSHPAWSEALRAAGYLPGPTNFFLATSPALTRLIDQTDPEASGLHVNRGDGPWPSGLSFRID